MNKNDLIKVSTDIRVQKQDAGKAVADIDKQISDLMAAREKRVHDEFVLKVKEKALRAAIRVMEDHDII